MLMETTYNMHFELLVVYYNHIEGDKIYWFLVGTIHCDVSYLKKNALNDVR